jgi:hypothetical protein
MEQPIMYTGIQIIGYLLIPVGIISFFKKTKYLLYLTVFFSGFTATSIFIFNNGFSLQPSYLFGCLFLIKQFLTILKNKQIIKPSFLLSIFLLICIVSLTMPNLVKNSSVFVINTKNDSLYTAVSLTSANFTQIGYFIFCFFIYWFVKDYLFHNPDKVKKLIKVFLYSCFTICVLGFYQLIATRYNLPYDQFFRQSAYGNIQTFGTFTREYAVAVEPSMFAYYLAPVFALVMSVEKSIFKHKFTLVILILVSGVLTTSTTFFIGFAAFLIKVILDKLISFIKMKKSKSQKLGLVLPISIFALLVAFLIAINVNDNINNILTTETYNKLFTNDNMSGNVRSEAFKVHLAVAENYPLLGVGFGSARSKDLLSTWLCNTGFISVSLFIIYLLILVNKLKKGRSRLSYGVSNFILIFFICAFASVPEPYALFIWLMMATGEELLIQDKYQNQSIDYKFGKVALEN